MTWSFEEMASVWCIYVLYLIILVEEHKLGAAEDKNRKVDFLLLDPFYNVQRDRNTENSEYDLFDLQVVLDVDKLLENVMKPRADGHLLCSSFQLFRWYKALL